MKTALFTGFERFGAYANNPTEILANILDQTVLADHYIYSMILPVDIFPATCGKNYGEIIFNKALEINADCILSFGVSSEVKGFRLERVATNWVENKKYCSEKQNNTLLNINMPPKKSIVALNGNIGISFMNVLIQGAGISFEDKISEDAGTYCCNALMFLLAQALKDNSRISQFFFHVPCTHSSVFGISDFDKTKLLVNESDLVLGVETILKSYK